MNFIFGLLLLAGSLQAQWQTTTYKLKGGWNSIYLHGDAKNTSVDSLFPDSGQTSNVIEVWRWNPNPSQMQFTQSPLLPNNGTPEWSKWVRGEVGATLNELTGQSAYLVKCKGSASDTYSIQIAQSPRPPEAVWVRNGGNLLGFPSLQNGSNYPTFSAYFASFPVAIAANTKVFKYVGGELGPGNPIQVFSPATEQLDRKQAYWFSSEVVGNFSSPVQLTFSNAKGLEFGRNGTIITARAVNRTGAVVSLTVSSSNSESAPSGQEAIAGPVPVTRRTFDSATATWTDTPISAGGFTEVIEPNGSLEISFGIDRVQMSGSSEALFASFLRFTSSDNLFDILIPARARKSSLAGLWVGDAHVTAVESKAQSDEVTPVGRSFPLRYLIHVSDDGTARVLSQVFLGPQAPSPHHFGLCTLEAGLQAEAKDRAMRLVSTHLPLDRILDDMDGNGSVMIPGSLTRTITVPFDDPTNPFVHQYHPDHDNKDPKGTPLGNKLESHTVTREVTFTFTETPPDGINVSSGWGNKIIGGNYAEIVKGLHKDGNGLKLNGSFLLHRVSELGSLSIN